MKRVVLLSMLLLTGLAASQIAPLLPPEFRARYDLVVKLATMTALSFIMIHVGYEFHLDKTRLRSYAWDYFVAATAAGFPWLFCAVYFVLVMSQPSEQGSFHHWTESLLVARFSAPTSAGVLFSMLAAAGLSATWIFRKARVLAIFDDLDTILLMIPLKMLLVGFRWQLIVVLVIVSVTLWLIWRYLNVLTLPMTWPWVLTYSAALTVVVELIYLASLVFDKVVPIHIEVLLPAFGLGAMIRGPGVNLPGSPNDHDDVLERPGEKRVAGIVSACFMVLVGLSMPSLSESMRHAAPGVAATTTAIDAASTAKQIPWVTLGLHVLAITLLSNLGKMFPVLCYRREAHFRERLAVAIGMCPRGEVGAGVLVVSLTYGIVGPMVSVAVLSLALNLMLTGVFIMLIRQLLAGIPPEPPATEVAPA